MSRRTVVIGAGAVGCISALQMAAQGWNVSLVDKGQLGAESSWAGGGILFPLLPWQYHEAVNRLALAGAAQYANLSQTLLEQTGIDPEYQACGMQIIAETNINLALQWCKTHQVSVEQHTHHLWCPDIAQVRNPRLLQALKAALVKSGVRLIEQTELLPLNTNDPHIHQWETATGERLEADDFVITAGAWSRLLLGKHALDYAFKPMRGQMLLFDAPTGLLDHIIYHTGFYLIPRKDGHILAGSTVEDVGFDKSTTSEAAASLYQKALEVLPALSNYPVCKHWSGLRPGSPDNIPVIGRHPEFQNLWLNTGHFRYGVTMAPASADQLISEMCLP